MEIIRSFKGNIFKDNRGIIKFINDFNIDVIKRFYIIQPEIGVIRAWQGHQYEKKWFCVLCGKLEVRLVNMKNYNQRFTIFLTESEFKIIEIPNGYYNGFISLESESQLLVFSNFSLDQSIHDDHRKTIHDIPW